MAGCGNYLVATVHWWAYNIKEGKRRGKEKEKEKKKKKENKTNQAALTGLLHYCTLLSKEFLLFSTMPIFIEMVMPIRTTIAVYLMVSLAIHALEDLRTWLTNIGSHAICFLVFHTALCFLSVVFSIMSSIALSAPEDIRATAEYRMAPLPAVLTLWSTWVCIGTSNGSNKTTYIETTVNNVLSCRTALGIPDVHPSHHLIGFRGCFNNTRFWSQSDIFE